MKIVSFVPIKLTNQRLPGKNLLPLGDKAVCQHLFDTLVKVKALDERYVFCSDEAIVPYIPAGMSMLKRAGTLDRPETKGLEIIESFVAAVPADIYVLAHVTNPFVKVSSIETALEKVCSGGYDSAFCANRLGGYCWYQGQPVNFDPENFLRTQDIEKVYLETGGFFIFTKEVWEKYHRRTGMKPYIHPVDRFEAADIDERDDYEFCKLILPLVEREKNDQ